ncbi:hypothetical protein V2J09_006964 [Rumex salicifolius]
MPERQLEAFSRFMEAADSVRNRLLTLEVQTSFPALCDLIRVHDPRVIALVETRISGEHASEVCNAIGFDGCIRMEASSFAGGIWLLWQTAEVYVLPLSLHPQHLTIEIKHRGEESWFFLQYMAARPRRLDFSFGEYWRISLSNNRPWLLAGDFNATRSGSERSRPSPSTQRATEIFSDWINNLDLIDMGFIGHKFTWWRGSDQNSIIAATLDRTFCNSSWRIQFPEATIHHLSAGHSDHSPLLIRLTRLPLPQVVVRPFRFNAAWLMHHKFCDVADHCSQRSVFSTSCVEY